MAGIADYTLQRVIIHSQGKDSPLAKAVGRDLEGNVSPILLAIGIPAALWQPWVAYGCYVTVAVMWFIADSRIERAVAAREAARASRRAARVMDGAARGGD